MAMFCYFQCLNKMTQKTRPQTVHSRKIVRIQRLPVRTAIFVSYVPKGVRVGAYKSLNGLAPEYMRSMFIYRDTVYSLRDAEGKLNIPKLRTNYLKKKLQLYWCGSLEQSASWVTASKNTRKLQSRAAVVGSFYYNQLQFLDQ